MKIQIYIISLLLISFVLKATESQKSIEAQRFFKEY